MDEMMDRTMDQIMDGWMTWCLDRMVDGWPFIDRTGQT